ncbi:MAG: sugar transferase [Polaromonas sp.]|nr:sugar transferase [Polaromonas sp.]
MAETNEMQSAAVWRHSSESLTLGLGRNNIFRMIESALDPLILVFSLWALALYFEGSVRPPYLILSVIVFSLTFPAFSRLRFSVERMIFSIFFHWFWIAGLLLLAGYATQYLSRFPLEVISNWLWLAPLAQIGGSIALRAATPRLLKLQGNPRGAVIVGMNHQGIVLAENIANSVYSDIDLAGFFDDRDEDRRSGQGNQRLLGKIGDLVAYVKQHRIQFIYLSLPMIARPRILQILDELKDTTASVYFVPDMFITDLVQARSDSVCGVTVISVCDTPFRGFNGALKRISDIIFSLLILILISPIMLIIAILVRLDSPGPVIFKQHRYGLDGEKIVVYKFRSMAVVEDGETVQQACRNDSRVTRLGVFLRKTSLDELPQFINVLQGRMSVVGPRPHAVAHNEIYRTLIKGYMVRHKVRPGITGWAQVNGQRGETDTLEKMQARIDLDLDYLRNWSLQLDIFIILKTIRLVFRDSAAY